MKFVIFEDLVNADPLNIHRETCSWYVNRAPNTTTTKWHVCENLETAERYATKELVKSAGCKRCNDCLDGAWIVDPKGL